MDNIITAFQNQLTANVPAIKYADEDWGQMDFYTDRPPVKYPAALIDIQDIQYTDAGDNRQHGVLTVAVRLYVLRLGNTSHHAPENQKQDVRQGWLACNQIIKAVHGVDFIKNGFAAPRRARMQRIKRRDGIYQRDIIFNIPFIDKQTVPERMAVRPTVSIKT